MSSAYTAYAQIPPTVNIYAWTDKTYYDPGETGSLYIVIRNDRTDTDLILQNISITYPWFAYLGNAWDGNITIAPSPLFVLSKNAGTVYNTTVTFTVPDDGRVFSGFTSTISIEVVVDKSPYEYSKSVPIYVRSTPVFASLQDMDQITTLFTVLVVLVIVCTIIIAATIFLATRRPQVTWTKEQKPE
jgi:hypothetical protein